MEKTPIRTNVRNYLLVASGIAALVYAAFFLFPINDDARVPPVGRYAGVSVPSTSKISVNDGENLLGIMFAQGAQIRIKVVTLSGEIVCESSLQQFNPHRVVAFNKITFSPDGRFAAFSTNDAANNLQSRIVLLDLFTKKVIDLARDSALGDLAYNYEAEEGPVWLDNDTLAYVHRKDNSAQELIFVNINTGREVLPRKRFSYTPSLSHSGSILAYSATGERGKSKVFLMDVNVKDTAHTTASVVELEGEFNNVSQISWSADDAYLAFLYRDEQSNREGISPVIIYDVRSRKPVCRIREYLSNPQWINNRFLLAGYWERTPFHGQDVHTFSKFVVFDMKMMSMTNFSIKALNDNSLVLRKSEQIVSVKDDQLVVAAIGPALTELTVDENVQREPEETSLDVNTWKLYKNRNFGISFKYPPDWGLNVASGDGYLNAILGKGTDGIDIRLTTIDGNSFNQEVFDVTVLNDASSSEGAPVSMEDFRRTECGGNLFYRIRKRGDLPGQGLQYTYYLNAPIYGKAFPDMTDVIIFTLKIFSKNTAIADPEGEDHPSLQVLKALLSTLRVEGSDRGEASNPDKALYQNRW